MSDSVKTVLHFFLQIGLFGEPKEQALKRHFFRIPGSTGRPVFGRRHFYPRTDSLSFESLLGLTGPFICSSTALLHASACPSELRISRRLTLTLFQTVLSPHERRALFAPPIL